MNKLSKCLVAIRSLDMDFELDLLLATKILERLRGPEYLDSINIDAIEMQNLYRTSQSRSQEIKFAVGMIVTHGNHSTDNSTGVIVGWHQINVDKDNVKFFKNCSHFVSPTKSCSNYSVTEQQTYYVILSENNEICYVEEGAITLTTPKWIDNDEIGRYFRTFKNTQYVPNEKLAECYPQDAAITVRIFQN